MSQKIWILFNFTVVALAWWLLGFVHHGQNNINLQAQNSYDFVLNPSLNDIGCSNGICRYDASRSSRLFVYVFETSQLWVYTNGQSVATSYDLQPFISHLGYTPVLDFVALTDDVVLFLGTSTVSGNDELTIYNINNNEITKPQIDFSGNRLIPCDSTPSTPVDNLHVFPDSPKVLLCARGETGQKLLVVNFLTEQIEQIIDIPVWGPSPGLLPWHKVLVGLDGNIYLQSIHTTAEEDVFNFAIETPPLLLENSIRIVKFDLTNGERHIIQLPIDVMEVFFDNLGSLHELIAVDLTGNLYYYNIGSPQSGETTTLLSIFDENSNLLNQRLYNPDIVFEYQSVDNQFAFVDDQSSSLVNISADSLLPTVIIFPSNLHTTVAESGETNTYTLALGTQPTADVVVSVASDVAQLTVSPSTLTFTPENWDTPQTVTVAAVHDARVEGEHISVITHSAASADPAYNGIAVASVTVTFADDD